MSKSSYSVKRSSFYLETRLSEVVLKLEKPEEIKEIKKIMNYLVSIIVTWFYLLGRGLLNTAIHSFTLWDKKTDHFQDSVTNYFRRETGVQEFDFIIVGAGSAGATVANRLSVHFNVLLLETGGEQNPLSYIAIMHPALHNNPDLDYAYLTEPQNASCFSLKNRQSLWNRGKSLGGSSSLNAMAYVRGHPKDFNNWASITGDERWNYQNVLPYFTKSEDYCVQCEKIPNDPTFNPLFHHTNGYLSISKPPLMNLVEEFLQASEWVGVPRTDLNGPYNEGASAFTHTLRNGKRCSTNTAFLDPARHRKTLTISKFSRVYKILFRGDGNEAYGVEYVKHGRPRVAFARKEVILSAGSIETPKLLMLSGIGPRDHLNSLGIPTLVDLPVGKNLQDHLGSLMPFTINDTTKAILSTRDFGVHSVVDFVFRGDGLLASSGMYGVSFHTSPQAQKDGEINWPDTQYTLLSLGVDFTLPDVVRLERFGNIQGDTVAKFFEPLKGRDGFSILVYISRPKSRGEILLRSPNYKDDPVIDPKYYLDPENRDIRAHIEALKRAVYLCENAPSFRKLGCEMSPVPFMPCKMYPFRSDSYWECFSRHLSATIFHHSGTAAMGKVGSPNTVVDSELRVLGTKYLRVIDSSVMPNIVSANTNGATIMIGERGSQFILDSWMPGV